ncbi:hypothetical protein PPERSA_01275 [Pseudocohnilembus persalinus]|uniref:Uncharacterized protein n=1 Tax=Pseudocohnilembus persalinus TaxID=266149 RepID=A0A0V0QGT1_PSEPJ|nr:hypothetical protein PPERSA_01275 [Pseudocohnilembus persalinus]|eukprot:KRX01372.1 hypothetical protein PPERSA_01275 [Pseudocohnilembus persalinus]
MITLDIYQYIRNLSQSSYSSVNRYFEFMQTQTIKSQDAKQKIESLIKDAKQIIGVGNNGSDQIKYQKKESFAGFEPIQDENQNNQENFNQIQVQLDQIYSEIKNVRADIKQSDFHTNQNQNEAYFDKNLSFFENQGVDNLTSNVWPKSRLLFAILSKMSKEGLINQEQKGNLFEKN